MNDWFEEVIKLRPHFNEIMDKYITDIIEVRYNDPYNEELQDFLIEQENEIIEEILNLFGKYAEAIDMAFDNPWEYFEEGWRCLELKEYEEDASDHFWYYILGDLCYAAADGRI